MHFSTSLKFLGAALLLPALLVSASPHSIRSTARDLTLIDPATGSQSETVKIIQKDDSNEYTVVGGWKNTPAIAEKMSKSRYNSELKMIDQKGLDKPFAHGYDQASEEDYYIIEEDVSPGEYDSGADDEPYPGSY